MFKSVALQVLLMACLSIASLHAQITTPAPSPSAKVEQTIGLTDVMVEYSRPAKKGRKIFTGDGLVPFGKMWRTGANKNTVITFDKDVKINGKELKAGSYALFTKPMANEWEIYFYNDTNNWGTPREWDDNKVAAKYTAKSTRTAMPMSNFTILFDGLTNNSGDLVLAWDNTAVRVPIAVNTREEASKSIERALGGPTASDYYNAASYYFEEGKDLDAAYTWIKKANEMNGTQPKFWMLRRQALIEAKLGKKAAAIATAKKSLDVAKAAGNMDYVRMNEASLREWGM